MNDPAKTPIDIEEQRTWIIDQHKTMGSWSELAKCTGIPSGTLSQFGSPKGYSGNEENIALKVIRYRQSLAAHAQIEIDMPERPGYFETETSRYLQHMLTYAQRGGRVIVAALGAGLGKTMSARQFAASYANVFVTTMSPSTAGVNNMQIEVLESLGEKNATGTPQKLTRRIRDRVANLRTPLIIIDEAQHLSEKAIEEIRSWNDACGVGIALFGNESVLQRLEGGNRRAAFAQLYSRVGLRLVRSVPLLGDIDALADAWGIFEKEARLFLRKIGSMPGGLRGATTTIELASMLASSDREVLALRHLRDAWMELSSRPVAA